MISNGLFQDEPSYLSSLTSKTRIGCFDPELLVELSRQIFISTRNNSKCSTIPEMIFAWFSIHKFCPRLGNKKECTFSGIEWSELSHQTWSGNHQFQVVHEAMARFMFTWRSRNENDAGASSPDENLYTVLQTSAEQAFSSKFGHESYVRATMQYSGKSQIDGTRMMQFVQEKFVTLVHQLERLLQNVQIRAWPTAVVETRANENDNPYEGFWLIGMDMEAPSARATLDPVLEKWNRDTCADARFSAATMVVWAEIIDGAVMNQQEIKEDTRTWPRPLAKPDPRYAIGRVTADSSSTATTAPVTQIGPSETPRKLRPAMDVLNRLTHDPSFDLDDYVVGYTDRHEGIMEKSAGQWISESTHEEWIPQARIQYFRRVSTGAKVWDRASKLDTIFR
jgi:uncharacterized protein (UPF0248 family)